MFRGDDSIKNMTTTCVESTVQKSISFTGKEEILPQGNQRERVMITDRAKRPELRSYTSAMFAVKTRGKEIITIAGICETDKPSSTPPAMPATPRKGIAEFQYPAGSHLLVR